MKYCWLGFVILYVSSLPFCHLAPFNQLSLPLDNVHISARNVLLTADEMRFSNASFSAKNLTVHADEFTFSGLLNDHRETEKVNYELFDYPALRSSINHLLNPCEDFYEFVCNGWITNNEIAAYDYKTTQFNINVEILHKQIKSIFDERNRYPKSRINELMFDLYEKCMDTVERERLKSKPLFDALRKVRHAKLKYITDWLILVRPHSLFYIFGVEVDAKNVSKNVLTIVPTGTLISYEYFIDDQYESQLKALRDYLTNVLKILIEDDTTEEFFTNSTEEIERRIGSFFSVERKIAEIVNSTERHQGDHAALYNLHSVADLEKIAPSVNWKKYIASIMPTDVLAELNINSLQINVPDMVTTAKIDRMVKGLSNTSLSDYIDWSMILTHISMLDSRFREARKEYGRVTLGPTESQPQWLSCQMDAVNAFPDLANVLYISRFFNHDTKPSLKQIVENIRESFATLITESNWMDALTKEKALLKVRAILDFIGYDENLFNQTLIEMKYAELSFESSWSYVNIVQAIGRWKMENDLHKLIEINDRKRFDFPPPGVNAFYDPTHNQIALLAGILQGTFFNLSLPLSMNFGGIGAVIGHEITHGFDDQGAQYDDVGNLRNWWDNETRANFLKLKQCFIEQYGSIEVPHTDGMHIDGEATQSENIADNGGMRAAYRAMKKTIENNVGKEKRIRGLEQFNEEQLFFINYAYTWCGKIRQEAIVDLLLNDGHSPDRYRVNVVLANQPEFFDAFSCPPDSAMKMNKKCRVW